MAEQTDYGGIYLAYFTGEVGTSLGIFVLANGVFSGGDLGGGVYGGTLSIDSKKLVATGTVSFRMNEGYSSITGAKSDLPVHFETPITLKLPLEAADYHEIESLGGPLNVRFEKVRAL